MSLVKRGDIWHYDFWFLGRRHVGTTRQTVKADASVCEQEVKRRLRRQSAGLEGPPAAEAPRFQDWAEVHFRERRPQMTRPEFLEDLLGITRFAFEVTTLRRGPVALDLIVTSRIMLPTGLERHDAVLSAGLMNVRTDELREGTRILVDNWKYLLTLGVSLAAARLSWLRLPWGRKRRRTAGFRPTTY